MMKMKKYWKNSKGSSLVEVMAAGVVLMILALMTLQSFSMSANIMEQGRKLKQKTSQSIEAAEFGEIPDEAEQAVLTFERMGDMETGILVTINRYGNIYLMSRDEGQKSRPETGMRDHDGLQNDR